MGENGYICQLFSIMILDGWDDYALPFALLPVGVSAFFHHLLSISELSRKIQAALKTQQRIDERNGFFDFLKYPFYSNIRCCLTSPSLAQRSPGCAIVQQGQLTGAIGANNARRISPMTNKRKIALSD